MNDDKIRKIAEEHVAWYLNSIRPLLIDHMVHGIKHGIENKENLQE